MVTMTLAVPKDLKERMDSFPEINWSEVARQAFLFGDKEPLERTYRSKGSGRLNTVTGAWEGFYGGIRCRRVSLPTYPFDRARHWLSRRDAGDAMDEEGLRSDEKERARALLGSRVGENVWEVAFGEESGAVIQDHRVKGKTIVSGASFLAMAKLAAEASEDRRNVWEHVSN